MPSEVRNCEPLLSPRLVQNPAPMPTQPFGVSEAEYETDPSGFVFLPPTTASLRKSRPKRAQSRAGASIWADPSGVPCIELQRDVAHPQRFEQFATCKAQHI